MEEILYVNKLNEVYLQIKCTQSQALELKEHFSYYAPNYKFHPKFRQHIWSGKISLYKYQGSLLPIGLYKELSNFAEKFNYKIKWNIERHEMINDITDEEITEFYDLIFKNSNVFPRDYQDDAIHRALTKKRGIIESATGSGKSLLVYSIIRFLLASDLKILLIVPNVSLTNQMFYEFSTEYGWSCANDFVSILYHNSNKFDPNKPILISTWQSLIRKKEDFFKKFDVVLIDEVHNASNKSTVTRSIQKILDKCINADYRIGFTGTLQEDLLERMTIIGATGPVLFTLTAGEAIDKGVLSKIVIANILLKYSDEEIVYMKNRSYPEEERFISQHQKRNKIFKYIISHVDKKDNTMILLRLIDQLKNVTEYLKKEFPDRKVYQIYGQTDADVREEIRLRTEKEEGVILVCSYGTMSVGVNIKKIHNVIFGSSTKSKIRTLQSLGRGLRLHESKKKLVLFDIVDDLRFIKRTGNIGENYVFKHFVERLRYYNQQGFKFLNQKVILEKL